MFNLRRAVRGLEGLQVRIGEADPVVDDGEALEGFNRLPSGHNRQLELLDSVHMHLNAALLSCILKAEAILNRVDAVDDGLEDRQKRVLRGHLCVSQAALKVHPHPMSSRGHRNWLFGHCLRGF